MHTAAPASRILLFLGLALGGALLSACSPAATDAEPGPALRGPEFYRHSEGFMREMEACMSLAGYEPEWEISDVNPGSGLHFPKVPPEQQSELRAALSECSSTVKTTDLPLADEEFQRATYDWLAGQRDCFEDAGFAVPPAPSFESFADQMATVGYIPWSPLDDAMGINGTASQQREALKACPFTTNEW